MAHSSTVGCGSGVSTLLQNWFSSEAAMHPAFLCRARGLQAVAQNVAPESVGGGCLAGGDCQNNPELGTGGVSHSLCAFQAAARPSGSRTAGRCLAGLDGRWRLPQLSQWSRVRRGQLESLGTGVCDGAAMARVLCAFRHPEAAFCGHPLPRLAQAIGSAPIASSDASEEAQGVRVGGVRRAPPTAERGRRAGAPYPPLVTRGETVGNRKTGSIPYGARDWGGIGLCAVHSFCMCSVCAVHE